MSDAFNNTTHALAQAILEEINRACNNPQHEVIHVSYTTRCLSNGINHCSVQVECKVGCGWLVEVFGNQAEALERKAIAIQKILKGEVGEPQMPLSGILESVFPEFVIESLPPMRKYKEFNA